MNVLVMLRDFVEAVLFNRRTETRLQSIVASILLLLIFAAGILHWVLFFNQGNVQLFANDWHKETLYYLHLQQAIEQGVIPWHTQVSILETQRFLANPEIVLSPQIVLLRWMSVGKFVVVNTALCWAIGYAGCLLIKRRHRLSIASFTMLILLWGFNGHIVSHLAVGHSMWNGYFFFRSFFWRSTVGTIPSPGHWDERLESV